MVSFYNCILGSKYILENYKPFQQTDRQQIIDGRKMIERHTYWSSPGIVCMYVVTHTQTQKYYVTSTYRDISNISIKTKTQIKNKFKKKQINKFLLLRKQKQ